MTLDVQARKILDLMARYHGAIGGGVIAGECGIRKHRVAVLLEDLEARGFVRQITLSGFWQITEQGRVATADA